MRELAVIIMTLNEAENLPSCLGSLQPLDCDIFVIDSGSTDRTVDIAREAGATVLSHKWETYASQFNWALAQIETPAKWVFRLDADERVSPELSHSIRNSLPQLPEDVTGAYIALRILFLGRWIRHGGMYPTWLLRVWRRGIGRCEDRWMDEHIALEHGTCCHLAGDLIHENQKGIDSWIQKHNGYATREARDVMQSQGDTSGRLSGQAANKRWIKENAYAKLPLFWRAWWYWAYRYFLLLGFLDGREGALFHFFQGLWYRSLVDAKVIEARRKADAKTHG